MSEPTVKTLKLAFIAVDKRFQFRTTGIDGDHVAQLLHAIKEGAEIEKMHVFWAVNGLYYLVDGFHRMTAYGQAGVKEVDVFVHAGTLVEARQFAAVANLKHSYALPLSSQSKMEILAEMKAPGAPWEQWSLSKVAAELGMKSHNTVSAWLGKLVSDGKLPAEVLQNKVVTTRAGKTIDTSRIGGSRTATPEQAKHAEQQQIGQGGSQWVEPYTTPAGEVQLPLGEDESAIRLKSKIKMAVKMGWLDPDQAELHQFEERSPNAADYRLRNKVTGELIDPHSRPADLVLEEKRAIAAAEQKVAQESEDNSEALNVAIQRESAVALPLLKLLETQGISACLDLPKDRRFKLMDDIRKGMMRLAHFYAQLAAAEDVSATVAEMSLFTLEKMRGEMLQGVRDKYGVDVPPDGSSSDAEMITMPVEGHGGKPYQLTVSHAGDADHSFELKLAWGHELAFYNNVLLTESQAIDLGNWLDGQIPDYDAEIEREAVNA